jgi:hypothetical protein
MKSCNYYFAAIVFLVFSSLSGCQNKSSKVKPTLASIDLLRGDIVLCNGNSFGEVNFSLSSKYFIRDTLNLAVSLLHSFEYPEAEKAFVKVLDADPECAMAYWGVAMSIYHAAWFPPDEQDLIKGSNILKIAESLDKTEREKDYLDAIGAYYTDWNKKDHATRAKNFEKQMEHLYTKHKDDTEAAIFYALALFSTRDRSGKEYINERKAGKILESIFPDQPNHPGIAHYLIHNYDSPELAHLALNTARKYADIAPSSAHAQHMPSHIFTRLGLWDESIQSNTKSIYTAKYYDNETSLDGNSGAEIHAMDYLIYAYLQKGNNAKANELYQYLQSVNKLVASTGPYNFGAIPARIFLENKDWVKAAQLKQHPSNVNWGEFPWEKALTHFARVLGATHIGDHDSAEKDLAILEALHKELIKRDDQYEADQVLVQIKSSEAWINLGKSNNEKALALMQEAADMEDRIGKHPKTPGEVLPARELLGDMLLALNKPEEALKAYQIDLESHPNRFNGIYGAAIASKRLGDWEKANMYFEELLKVTEGVTSNRPEIAEANTFVAEINL